MTKLNPTSSFSLTRKPARIAIGLGLLLALGACESSSVDYKYPSSSAKEQYGDAYREQGPGLLGEDGLTLFGGSDKKKDGSGAGIGVNAFLWRATLDTLSFMPLTSADPFGGVIITDWYSPPENPDERFKVNAFILGRDLRVDGLRTSIFRQVRNAKGQWNDAVVSEATVTDLENSILTRARQLRIANVNPN